MRNAVTAIITLMGLFGGYSLASFHLRKGSGWVKKAAIVASSVVVGFLGLVIALVVDDQTRFQDITYSITVIGSGVAVGLTCYFFRAWSPWRYLASGIVSLIVFFAVGSTVESLLKQSDQAKKLEETVAAVFDESRSPVDRYFNGLIRYEVRQQPAFQKLLVEKSKSVASVLEAGIIAECAEEKHKPRSDLVEELKLAAPEAVSGIASSTLTELSFSKLVQYIKTRDCVDESFNRVVAERDEADLARKIMTQIPAITNQDPKAALPFIATLHEHKSRRYPENHFWNILSGIDERPLIDAYFRSINQDISLASGKADPGDRFNSLKEIDEDLDAAKGQFRSHYAKTEYIAAKNRIQSRRPSQAELKEAAARAKSLLRAVSSDLGR